MKKGQIVEGVIEKIEFPNKGILVTAENERVVVKNTIPGQKIKCLINKVRHKKAEGRVEEIISKAPQEIESNCPHFGVCGGCIYKTLPYENQLEIKKNQVYELLAPVVKNESDNWFEGIAQSPVSEEYRNKMEFTFGDEYKDGPLALGMHKRGSFYDIVTVSGCRLIHHDYSIILDYTLDYFKDKNISYFHRIRHEGYLRHLLVRRAVTTGEILVDLVTTSSEDIDLGDWVSGLVALESKLEGKISGILHTLNDSLADAVIDQGTDVLYGKDYFYEELMGLRFKISPFSFFQTNSKGAEVLYSKAREYALDAVSREGKDKPVIFDLYSGTGTIAQMMAPVAKHVTGVEIIEEAVEAAKMNAEGNGLHNCEFIAGDVLKVLDDLNRPQDKPDLIILDPPRDGCHPKALPKIIAYGAPHMVYISCKASSLARDLITLQEGGYKVERVMAIDQFPNTQHVETVCLLNNRKADSHIKLSLDMDEYYDIIEKEQAENK